MRSDAFPRYRAIAESQSQDRAAISRRLSAAIEALLSSFVGSNQPQVRMACDRQGQLYWQVYDPVNRAHHRFDTEDEVRVWLEQRYYH